MIKLLFFIPLLVLNLQNLGSKKIYSEGKLMVVDKFGCLYSSKNEILYKYNPSGKTTYKFSDKLLGNVSSLDATNPLRVLAYYQEAGMVIFLDNTLSIHNQIQLNEFGYDQTTLACSSNNESFWLYDAINFSIVKLNEYGQQVTNSGNLLQLTGHNLNPNYLIEANDLLYLNDSKIGILVFDMYGGYLKTIPIQNLSYFQIIDEHIVYQKNGSIMDFDLKLLKEKKLNEVEEKYKFRGVSQGNIYYQSNDSIIVMNSIYIK